MKQDHAMDETIRVRQAQMLTQAVQTQTEASMQEEQKIKQDHAMDETLMVMQSQTPTKQMPAEYPKKEQQGAGGPRARRASIGKEKP